MLDGAVMDACWLLRHLDNRCPMACRFQHALARLRTTHRAVVPHTNDTSGCSFSYTAMSSILLANLGTYNAAVGTQQSQRHRIAYPHLTG